MDINEQIHEHKRRTTHLAPHKAPKWIRQRVCVYDVTALSWRPPIVDQDIAQVAADNGGSEAMPSQIAASGLSQ